MEASKLRRQKLIDEWIKPRVLTGDLEGARRCYDAYSNAGEFGSFEHLVAEIELQHTTLRQAAEARAERDKVLHDRICRAIEKRDLVGLEEIAREGIEASSAVGAALKTQARRLCHEAFGTGDHEKEAFLAHLAPHLLLAARAGSGKSSAMAIKVAQLHRFFAVPLNRILVLAFNKAAAREIKGRIRRLSGTDATVNARTFHALAYQLTQPVEAILYDKDLRQFIGAVRREIWNDSIETEVLRFFRREVTQLQAVGGHLSDRDYLIYARSASQVTLRGENVKSTGEKWFADFLFEHGILYAYERPIFWGKRVYRPDFTILAEGREAILEHWGIDLDDPTGEVPKDWGRDWADYRAEIERKRAFWREDRRGRVLLETSVKDTRRGRGIFENILKNRLEQAGIICRRLTDEEIARHVSREQEPRLDRMFESFIQRAKKASLSPDAIDELRRRNPAPDPRTDIFEAFASRVYHAYEAAREREGMIDFDVLLERAVARLDETGGHCQIGDGGPQACDINWLLIDEFQDFTASFRKMVDALRRANRELRVIGVGDDWQAINGFAGSDLAYFRDFMNILPGGERAWLLTNRRSAPAVVKLGNAIMDGYGTPAKPANGRSGGETRLAFIDDVWIELRSGQEYNAERDHDSVFVSCVPDVLKNDARLVAARALKLCHAEIVARLGTSFLLLSRTNHLFGLPLKDFAQALRACFTGEETVAIGDIDEKIHVMTAHKSKGLEADHVILLDGIEGRYPLLHSDEALYRLFGKGIADALEEERRLFYVACTRARESLLIISEKDRLTPFLLSPKGEKLLGAP